MGNKAVFLGWGVISKGGVTRAGVSFMHNEEVVAMEGGGQWGGLDGGGGVKEEVYIVYMGKYGNELDTHTCMHIYMLLFLLWGYEWEGRRKGVGI